MVNRPRPRCTGCEQAMAPVFQKRIRGSTFSRVPDVFWCNDCEALARGRRARARFLK